MEKKTYVLVHGGFHGAWCWRFVAERLRAEGHEVSTPTQTGVGERKHLFTPDITLDTFVVDIVNHIESEELDDVILVAHSFGGCSITGAADRIADRIRHLVYLDGIIVGSGQSPFDTLSDEVVNQRRQAIERDGNGIYFPVFDDLNLFGMPNDHEHADWVRRRMTPQPANVFETSVELRNPIGNGLPTTYVVCTDPYYPAIKSSRDLAMAQDEWNWIEIATGHECMVLEPELVASTLLAIP